MPYFHHRFDHPTGYLHHRDPYLLIDRVETIEEQRVIATKTITGEEPFIRGHFPGAPIVPGAMMQEMTSQTGGVLIAANFNPMEQFDTSDPFFNEFALGVLVKVKSARYRGFGRPGQTLEIDVRMVENVDPVFDFVGRVRLDDRIIMRNEFQLSNIASKTLQGQS